MYKVMRKDIEQASQCLESAFQDYPVFTYIFPDYEERQKNQKHVFRFLVSLGLINGEVTASSERLEGISIWYQAQAMQSTLFDALGSGIINLYLKLDRESFKRFLALNKHKQIVRNELVNGMDYFMLDMLGVNPAWQKKGIASRLLTKKLETIDQVNKHSYLETSKSDNVTYYEKFGFSCIREYMINELKVFCLIRKL